jgi:hypothetical protein
MPPDSPRGLADYFAARFKSKLERVERLGPDSGGTTTAKAEGYGEPLKLILRRDDGTRWTCVFHTARSNEFGHDRRSDRAAEQVLAFDTFGEIPRHVRALDIGVLSDEGPLSLAGTHEHFLVTEWAEGTPYAADLRRIAHGDPLAPIDLERVRALATYLAGLHVRLPPDPVRWHRALRDTVGSGEGIFGIADAFGPHAPGATPARLAALEQAAVEWRWRLKPRVHRLSRTHGDFHPFNLVFREGADFTALDASRGCAGEPADDLTALAINYVFFAADHPARWRTCFAPLWRALWGTYLELTQDRELLACAAPFLAWRALVVCCPRFYPQLSAAARDRLLGLAECALAAPTFDPDVAGELFP